MRCCSARRRPWPSSIFIGTPPWLLTRQLHDTIDAELKGLAEQYTAGGLNRLVRTVADRSETPGNSLYFVADPKAAASPAISPASRSNFNSLGPVEFEYSRPAEGIETRLAFANVFRLPGGYRLIVGRDIEDRRELARVIRSAMLWGSASWCCSASAAAIW